MKIWEAEEEQIIAIIEAIKIIVLVLGEVKMDISSLLIITDMSSRRERPSAKRIIFDISGLNSLKIKLKGFSFFWVFGF